MEASRIRICRERLEHTRRRQQEVTQVVTDIIAVLLFCLFVLEMIYVTRDVGNPPMPPHAVVFAPVHPASDAVRLPIPPQDRPLKV